MNQFNRIAVEQPHQHFYGTLHKYTIREVMRTSKPFIYSITWLLLLVCDARAGEVAETGVSAPAVEIPVETNAELLLPDALPDPLPDPLHNDSSAPPPEMAGQDAAGPPNASDVVESPEIQAARARLLEIEQSEGAESPSIIQALEALAVAEIEARDFNEAEASIKRAIEVIERNFGLYSQRLADPLALLGELYIGLGRLDDAVEAYRRAQHVAHRADGVYTLDQLDYLEKISSVFIEKRKFAEADRHKNFSFFVSEQNYGPDSPALVPAMMKLGGWLRQVGKTREARKLFERAAAILEDAYGPNDPSLIEPLLALGSTTRKRGQYRKQREAALQRMINIVENSNADAADKAESWAKLGDFYILVDDSRRAAEAYSSGWEVLQSAETLPIEERAILGEPKLLHFQRRVYLMANTPRATVEGYDRSMEEFPLELEFEVGVGVDGRVTAVRAVDLNATNATRRQLRRYVREARFRPAVVDGKPVPVDNFRFKETVIIVRPEGS